MAAFTGEIVIAPSIVRGAQHGHGDQKFITLAGSGINPYPYYSLACFDNTNVRHYWVDLGVSMSNAPVGPTYVTATLVVLGKF
jgi:hypothetical protein